MIFPILKFWRYSPIGWIAACIWNICELLHIQAPFAPTLFGLAIGIKGKRIK